MKRERLGHFAGLRNGDLVRYASRPLLPRHTIVLAATCVAVVAAVLGGI